MTYLDAAKGYIADVPEIVFYRCDQKVFHFNELTSFNFETKNDPIVIRCGHSRHPVAFIDALKEMNMEFESAAITSDLFAMSTSRVDKLNKLKADVAFNLYVKDEGITVEEWLNTWLSSYCLSIKDTTRGKYASDLRLHIIPALGKIHLVKLDGAMIQRFYSSLVKKGIAPKSVRNLHGTLHKALNQAVKLGIFRVNPANACDLPKVIKHEMTPVPDDELGNFLNAIKDSPYYAYYYVMIFTGMRRAELIGLTWDCVNFVCRTIRVYHQFNRNLTKPGSQYEFMTLKNGKERTFRPA